MNKVVYVQAFFKPVGYEVNVRVPTGEKTRGFFGEKDVTVAEKRFKQTGSSDREIDGQRLSEDMAVAIAALNATGFEVVAVTPVVSGAYAFDFKAQGITSSKRWTSETEAVSGGASYGWGYGYSYTEGVTIIAKKSP